MPIPSEHKTVQARTLLHQLMTAQTQVRALDFPESELEHAQIG